MTIITSLDFFETVYLKTDPDQLPRMVTNVEACPGQDDQPVILYQISMGTQTSRHYEGELSREPDPVRIIRR